MTKINQTFPNRGGVAWNILLFDFAALLKRAADEWTKILGMPIFKVQYCTGFSYYDESLQFT